MFGVGLSAVVTALDVEGDAVVSAAVVVCADEAAANVVG